MAAPNPELSLTAELFQTTITKVAVRARLRVSPANIGGTKNDLGSGVVNTKLSFGAGINCDTPYGCTDIDYTSSPSIVIIRPPSIVPVRPVNCQSNVALVFNLETNFEVNYRNITTKLKVATANMSLNKLNIFANNVITAANLNVAQNQLYDSSKDLNPTRALKSTLLMKCCGNKNFDTMPSVFRREYSQFNSSN
jgi:hypothetical protein